MDTEKVHVHYHMFANYIFGVEKVIIMSWEEVGFKRDQITQKIQDLTGGKIKDKTEYVTIFDNGAYVKWQPCYYNECGFFSSIERKTLGGGGGGNHDA